MQTIAVFPNVGKPQAPEVLQRIFLLSEQRCQADPSCR